MRTIPEAYKKNGWNYALRSREGNVALYSQHSRPNWPDWDNSSAYEVVVVRLRKGSPPITTKIRGKQVTYAAIEAGEYLPRTSEWGTSGWTCHTRERAKEKMREVALLLSTRSNRRHLTPRVVQSEGLEG
jgi:hypothetical protein